MRLQIETWEEKQYRLKAWFVYRHIKRNPDLCKDIRLKEFYSVLDRYFVEKYTDIMGSCESARKEIEFLFRFESERLLIMNEKL